MNERLTTFFSELQAGWQRRSEVKASENAARKAIAASDPDSLGKALNDISPSEVSDALQKELLKAAIDKGDVKTFNVLLAFTGDPNVTITEAVSTGRGGRIQHWPLLAYALKERSHDVALDLASDPRVDIRKLTNSPPAARRDVAAVLARRFAELHRRDAAIWEKVAENLAPTAQPL
jgi:hypothetical protein